ncbi:hypothetical protein [Flavobacterium selenitireducens]|uniref:hypothetical protein n=1 Tax=Flavobacterium selenitireducens TaxID=2722704 RepID=UPI00168BD47D|nr:hypothetical protein [Flavobacterium selenitireducens]MBD3584046.1 hypothetical protein [Flavobacterium selenitireducens]
MTTKEIITASIIHIVIPLLGFLLFLSLNKAMKKNTQNAPEIELFTVFINYGILLIIVLTELFWKWSGIASLGTFYLIFGAPIIMGLIILRNKGKLSVSIYHKSIFFSGILYFVITPLAFITIYFLE